MGINQRVLVYILNKNIMDDKAVKKRIFNPSGFDCRARSPRYMAGNTTYHKGLDFRDSDKKENGCGDRKDDPGDYCEVL